jgi:uncharacterized protein (AIM24 family)
MKLGRLEEAEPAFIKALELSDNPKIHYYLGSIYERLQRFQDAIYRYRQAGASVMVRRVEDRLSGPGPARRRDDTAEFKAKEVQDALQHLASGVKKVEPMSKHLLAESAPPRETDTIPPVAKKDDTARFRRDTTPFAAVTLPPTPAAALTPSRFRLLGNGLIEAQFTGKLFIRQGTIYSYSGNLTFWVKEPRADAPAPLVIVTGNGRLILTDQEREVSLVEVVNEIIHVDPRHVLAADEGVIPRSVRIGEGPQALEFLEIEGHGTVALSVSSRPLALAITPDLPASVPAASVIYWNGALTPRLIEDTDVFAVMTRVDGKPTTLVRLEGTGQLMVEQWLGDRTDARSV